MALTNSYVQIYGQLPEVFAALARGQAPAQFTVQHLKDLGFASSNHRAIIPLLKSLGFLSADGTPTQRYHDYRDSSRSRQVLGEALRDAYGDLFVIRAHPTEADRPLIEGKFKSVHNVSDRLAKLMGTTFFALLELADVTSPPPIPRAQSTEPPPVERTAPLIAPTSDAVSPPSRPAGATLHYNIQIHLPATKDIEVYNAIFRSLREHLVD